MRATHRWETGALLSQEALAASSLWSGDTSPVRETVQVQHISRRAWLIWAAAVAAYLVAVLQRTSLGVSGLEAAQRLEVSAAVLSTIAVVQLLVYVGMQIPVGVLVDRVGPRALIAIGAALMAVGQVSMALAHSLPLALLARLLVGAGDAMTWLSAIRLVAAWFPPRRVPLFTQLTGMTGQLGQVLSAIPLLLLLHGPGWTPAFLSVAALSLMMVALSLLVLRDSPAGPTPRGHGRSWADVRVSMGQTWRNPGTRLAFWTHAITPFSPLMFLLLWGYPFLVSAQGLSRATASSLFTLMAVVGIAAGPVLGVLVSRHPVRRSRIVLGVVIATIVVWTVVLALPGPAPLWLLVALVVVLAIAGPTSVIAFDYARTFNPPGNFGTASGMTNVGGFSASLVTILAVGLLLNITGAGQSYSLEGFRVAMCSQYVVWAIGITAFVRASRRVRAQMAAEGAAAAPTRDALRPR